MHINIADVKLMPFVLFKKGLFIDYLL